METYQRLAQKVINNIPPLSASAPQLLKIAEEETTGMVSAYLEKHGSKILWDQMIDKRAFFIALGCANALLIGAIAGGLIMYMCPCTQC